MMFLVPNHVHDAIHEAIDKKLEGRPMEAEERQSIYSQLLDYFDKHGVIPDFTLTPIQHARP